MAFPSFDDFLSEMGEDRIFHWSDGISEANLKLVPPITPENMQSFSSSVIAGSQLVAIAMMRDYHEWLIEQLKRKSLRLV